MSLEAASVDYKFENEKNLLVWIQKVVILPDLRSQLLVSASGWGLEATLAATSITHLNLQT